VIIIDTVVVIPFFWRIAFVFAIMFSISISIIISMGTHSIIAAAAQRGRRYRMFGPRRIFVVPSSLPALTMSLITLLA